MSTASLLAYIEEMAAELADLAVAHGQPALASMLVIAALEAARGRVSPNP